MPSFVNKLGLTVDENGIITTTCPYKGFKVLDREVKDGDWVIPTKDATDFYFHTIQEKNWMGIVWNSLDHDEMHNFYPIDAFDSYNVQEEHLVAVEPTKEAINAFIDLFKDSNADQDAVSKTYEVVHQFYPEYDTRLKSTFPSCPICGCRLTRSNTVHTDEDGNICHDCYEHMYRECPICHNRFKRSRDDNENLCPSCRKREVLLPYHHYAPPVEFYGDSHEKTQPFMGIELEIDEGGRDNSSVRTAVRTMNHDGKIFMYCSADSSIPNGFEMITQPATLEYHNSIKGIYSDLFKKMVDLHYTSHDNMSCGLHVHFNRDFFSEDEENCIKRLLFLVEKFWDEIIMFSRRNHNRIEHYTKKPPENTREYYRHSNQSGRHEDHYYAINIANRDTIEFRMFRGTLNLNTFFATLQFVNNCILAARFKSDAEIKKMTFEDLIDTKELKKYWKRRVDLASTEE